MSLLLNTENKWRTTWFKYITAKNEKNNNWDATSANPNLTMEMVRYNFDTTETRKMNDIEIVLYDIRLMKLIIEF